VPLLLERGTSAESRAEKPQSPCNGEAESSQEQSVEGSVEGSVEVPSASEQQAGAGSDMPAAVDNSGGDTFVAIQQRELCNGEDVDAAREGPSPDSVMGLGTARGASVPLLPTELPSKQPSRPKRAAESAGASAPVSVAEGGSPPKIRRGATEWRPQVGGREMVGSA